MARTRRRYFVALMAGWLLLLAACGGPEPTPTPTLTATFTASPGPVPAQFTVTPSPTTSPTPTAIPPTAPPPTLTPSPSPMPPTPTATAIPTNTPSPEPTAVALVLDVSVGAEPQDIAVANGFLWVIHPDGEIRVLTAEGVQLTAIHAEAGAVSITSDGQRLWVAHRSGIVTQIDGTTGAITARWPVPCDQCLIRGIHWDGSRLWVSNFAESTLSRIDAASGAVTTFSAGAESPTAITSDAAGLLVLHQSLAGQSVVLTRHDPATGAVQARVTAAGFPTAVLSDGADLWLSLRETERGVIVHYDAPSLTETWRAEAAPINDLLLAAGSLWSADFANDTVTQRNPATGEVLDVYLVGDLPQALAYDSGLLWVVNRRAGTLTRLWVGF